MEIRRIIGFEVTIMAAFKTKKKKGKKKKTN
jgi:hypothetical protein